MARDRQRAKQRRRRAAGSGSSGSGAPTPGVPSPRADDPARDREEPLGHDDIDPIPAPDRDESTLESPAPTEHASAASDELADALHGDAPAGELDSDESQVFGDAELGAGATPPAAERQKGSRVGHFLRNCWKELQRVQWPDRRQVSQATGVVLGFVVIAGGYLGLMDIIFRRVVNFII